MGDAFTGDVHGKFITAVFTLCTQMMGQPPHSRVEKQQRFHEPLNQIYPQVNP
ncbi:MAG: hypothetical protein K9N55_21415 [Phycisphaerae bacterium]|nr:hypothetical protein [Phycisphaerae bacterium]